MIGRWGQHWPKAMVSLDATASNGPMYSQIDGGVILCAHDHCIHRQRDVPSALRCAHGAPTRPRARSGWGGGIDSPKSRQRDPAGKIDRSQPVLEFTPRDDFLFVSSHLPSFYES